MTKMFFYFLFIIFPSVKTCLWFICKKSALFLIYVVMLHQANYFKCVSVLAFLTVRDVILYTAVYIICSVLLYLVVVMFK